MKDKPIYHTGILARGRTAGFQFGLCVDFLRWELLQYTRLRQTTKTAARERMREHGTAALAQLNAKYPGRNFARIVVD